MIKKIIFSFLASSMLLTASCSDNSNSVINQNPVLQQSNISQQEIAAFSTPQPVGLVRFAKVSNSLYRGSVPNENDMKKLKAMGIKTFVSFRGGGTQTDESGQIAEEKAIAKKLNVGFIDIPLPFDKPIPDAMISQFFKAVDNKQPVYAHCLHGRDRTGTMVAFYRMKTEGISGQEALKDIESYGFVQADYPIFTKQVLSETQSLLKKL